MTRYILISDIHADIRLPHAKVSKDNLDSDRFRDVRKIINDAFRMAQEHSCDRIFILGDLFDTHNTKQEVLLKTYRQLQTLKVSTMVQVTIIAGNHDAYTKTGSSYTTDLARLVGLDVVTSWADEYGGLGIDCLDWTRDEQFIDTVEQIKERNNRILFCHQTFNGAKEGTYTASSGISPKTVGHYDYVFSGHIHARQRINNIIYIGSPLQFRFSEEENDTGITLLYYKHRGDVWVNEHIPLNSPRFMTFTLDCRGADSPDDVIRSDFPALQSIILETAEDTQEQIYLRIKVFGSAEVCIDTERRMNKLLSDIEQSPQGRTIISTLRQDIASSNTLYRRVYYDHTITPADEERIVTDAEDASPSDVIREYIEKGCDKGRPKVFDETLVSIGLELL